MTTSDSSGEHLAAPLAAGSKMRDQVAGSNDEAELRAELDGVGEPLSPHEGFDRAIAENVRRSGELMLEMLTMRDAMAASADSENRQERDRILGRLTEMDTGLQAIRTQVEAMADQVSDLRQSLGSGHQLVPPPPEMVSVAPSIPDFPEASWNAPQVIDIIVHQVHKATVALSLQRYLGKIDTVAGVDAREFAEGVLRMQVTAHRPLTRDDLSGWSEGGAFTVLQVQPHIIELTLGDGA